MDIASEVYRLKQFSATMAASSDEVRKEALRNTEELLRERKEEIFAANKEDLKAAEETELPDSIKKRLAFTEDKLKSALAGIEELIAMKDPVGKVLLHRELDTGLLLRKITCPIGVIGVIFEARPDAMIQIASLCLRSGNCAVLKGGKETARTNKVLFELIKEAAERAGLSHCLLQAESHADIDELLMLEDYVDLLIPRGSNAFVRYIMEHTRIPVMGHADGICHIYVDKDADIEKSLPILLDAKLQYSAACNAVETVLLDIGLSEEARKRILTALEDAGIAVNGPFRSAPEENTEAGLFEKEYLSNELTVGLVDGVEEAIRHINTHGSHHTDCILTENEETAKRFTMLVDSAGVYVNCSTRFADGYRYGFGAEVGISTSKLHARGPVGLEGLLTYKYILQGSGQIVGDYVSGKKEFHFRDLQ